MRKVLSGFFIPLLFVCCAADHKPTDNDIVALFNSHRAQFDRLLQMGATEPKVFDVYLSSLGSEFDGAQGKMVLPSKRRAAFESTMTAIGAYGVSYSDDEVCYKLWVNGSGMGPGMDWKGICYRTRAPNVVASTDDPAIEKRDDRRRVYRHINGCWYVFYNPST